MPVNEVLAGLGGKGQVRKSRVLPKEQQESSRLEEAQSRGKRQSTIMEFFSRKRRVVESTPPQSGESDGAAANNVDTPSAESDRRATGSRPGEDTAPFDDGLLAVEQWRMHHAISPGSRIVSWNVGLQGYWSIRHELVAIVEQCCPSLIFEKRLMAQFNLARFHTEQRSSMNVPGSRGSKVIARLLCKTSPPRR